MDCRVVVEAAVPVYDVGTPDEAVRIAISKTGEMLNPDLNYVEIDMGERACPHCGEHLETAFIAADEGLVALELEMTVFNVEREEHASRIARKEIGQCLENIPLEVLEVEIIEGTVEDEETEEAGEAVEDEEAGEAGEDEETEGAAEAEEAGEDGESASQSSNGAGEPHSTDEPEAADDDSGSDGGDASTEDDEVLPEFEDLIE